MSETAAAERAEAHAFTNPLDHVIPTLERLGITSNGEYHYCVRTHDDVGDFISIIRSGADTALSLYARPTPAIAPNGSHQDLIRNQTLLRTPRDDLLLVTGDVLRCSTGGNHALRIKSVLLSEITDGATYSQQSREDFFALLTHLEAIMDKIHPDNQVSEQGVQNRLGDVCEQGDTCLHMAIE